MPRYYVGKCSDHVSGVSIRMEKRCKRWSWRRMRRVRARKFIVRYIGADLGHFWSWES